MTLEEQEIDAPPQAPAQAPAQDNNI